METPFRRKNIQTQGLISARSMFEGTCEFFESSWPRRVPCAWLFLCTGHPELGESLDVMRIPRGFFEAVMRVAD
jgi:hypothetical protein